MKLIPNAGKVAKRASSMWLIYGGVALQVADLVVPQLGLPNWVAIAVTAAAAGARLVKQEGLSHGD